MYDCDVIVIGSGAGGLAAALTLAMAGKKTLVFEQHYLPGGWCHSFNLDGYQFSPGVHYIGALHPGGTLRDVYERLGVTEDLSFYELNPDGIDHVQLGHERFDIPRGLDAYKRRLKDRFPREANGIDRYFRELRNIADVMQESPAHHSFLDSVRDVPRMWPLLSTGLLSVQRRVRRWISDPALQTILTIRAGNYAMQPSRAPFVLHAITDHHFYEGGYYPKGGAKALPRAFIRQLRKYGGEVHVNTPVQRILLDASRRATGVELADGRVVHAPTVISNADPHVTYSKLLDPTALSSSLRRRLARTRYSMSAVSLFAAVDCDVRARGLDSGNYWYAGAPSTEAIFDDAKTFDPVNPAPMSGGFVTFTTLKDPSKRKDGRHTLEAFGFVGNDAFDRWRGTDPGERPDEYERSKQAIENRLIELVQRFLPDVRDHLVFTNVGTPLTNHFYTAGTGGNMYGTEKVLSLMGPMAYPVRTEVEGLLMCGSSTLGHGVAGATMSGLVAAMEVLGCEFPNVLPSRGVPLRVLQAEPEVVDDGARNARAHRQEPSTQRVSA